MKLLFQEWKHSKCFSTRTLKPRKIVSVYTHREYGCLLLRMILFLLDNHCLCCDFIHSFLISVLNSVWVWPLSLCTELLGGGETQLLVFLFAEESLNCWSSSSWKTKIILHTQVRIHIRLLCPRFLAQFVITVCPLCRIVIPGFLPAMSRGILGELWPHAEDSADRVQRPQTDTDTQGGLPLYNSPTLIH